MLLVYCGFQQNLSYFQCNIEKKLLDISYWKELSRP